MPAQRERRWKLPSGAVFHSPNRPHRRAELLDDQPPVALSAEGLNAVLGDTVAKVHSAIQAGDRAESDRLLRHAVHLGVAPTDLILAFAGGDQLVEPSQSGGTVGAGQVGDLAADPPQPGESPPVGDGPAADDEVVGQVAKSKSRSRPRSS